MTKIIGSDVSNIERAELDTNDLVDALFGIGQEIATLPLSGTETTYIIQDGKFKIVPSSAFGGGGGGSGDVTGPSSSTPGHVSVFADGTGKHLSDGGAPGSGLAFQPFLGRSSVLWTRPVLDISGPSNTFNTWLNHSGDGTFGIGIGNNEISASQGINYVPGDTITLAGGTFTSPGIITISDTTVVSATIVNPGTGGIPGKAIVVGTTGSGAPLAAFDVTISGSGVITSIDGVLRGGDYTTNPTVLGAEPIADASGSGITGAVFNVSMGAFAGSVTTQGSYTVFPSNPVGQSASSGSGTGASWLLFSNSTLPVATDGTGGAPLTVVMDCAANISGVCLTLLMTPLGSAPWTVTCSSVIVVSGPSYVIPIALYNSSTKQAMVVKWLTAGQLALVNYASADTPMASSAAGRSSNSTQTIPSDYNAWFRVTNDGTFIVFSVSMENVYFDEVFRVSANGFGTPFDFIGFGMDRADNGVGQSMVGIWNWVTTSP